MNRILVIAIGLVLTVAATLAAHDLFLKPASFFLTPNNDRVLRFTTWAAGTYVLGISTLPRVLRLDAKDFNAYLESDGVPDVLAARKKDAELDKPARKRYHKHVKTTKVQSDTAADYEFKSASLTFEVR